MSESTLTLKLTLNDPIRAIYRQQFTARGVDIHQAGTQSIPIHVPGWIGKYKTRDAPLWVGIFRLGDGSLHRVFGESEDQIFAQLVPIIPLIPLIHRGSERA
jgi:hypothetical protein